MTFSSKSVTNFIAEFLFFKYEKVYFLDILFSLKSILIFLKALKSYILWHKNRHIEKNQKGKIDL